jgi:hypothetical protein
MVWGVGGWGAGGGGNKRIILLSIHSLGRARKRYALSFEKFFSFYFASISLCGTKLYLKWSFHVRHVTGNDQDYLGESPEWLFRYLRFSKRATIGVRATYATR